MEQKRFCMSDYIMRIVQNKVRKDTILKILLLSFPLMHNLGKCPSVWHDTAEACSTADLLSHTNFLIMCFLPRLDFKSHEINAST